MKWEANKRERKGKVEGSAARGKTAEAVTKVRRCGSPNFKLGV